MDDALAERVEALERTVADGEFDPDQTGSHAELQDRLSALEDRLDTVEDRIEELDAATQALRGYVGNIRSVNEDVEQRADAALAKAEALESTLDGSKRPAEPSTANEPANSKRDPGFATRENTPPEDGQMADGDRPTESARTARSGRCRECGRIHDDEQSRRQSGRDESPPGATDGGSSRSRGGQTAEDPLVPGESDDTGTLQRIRELL